MRVTITSPIDLICREWRQTHEVRRQGTHLLDRQEALCRSCHGYIRWVRTENGKVMPLDPEPDPEGRFLPTRWNDAGGRRVVHYIRDEEMTEGLVLYSSHYASCPRKEKQELPEREAYL